jgi:hypothetical protein
MMLLPRLCWLVPLLVLRVGADPEMDLLCEPRSVQPYLAIPGQAIITGKWREKFIFWSLSSFLFVGFLF